MLSNDLQIVLNAFQLVEHRIPIGRSLLIEQSERTKREHYNGCNGKKKERALVNVGHFSGRSDRWLD
jgi:hypothetical protein